jgi:trigger factor
LSVEIDESEVDGVIADAYRTLSRQVRVPGFRPGKVPRRVLEARLGGAQAVRADALRDALPDFYSRAVRESELDPIAAPEIDITAGADDGAVTFDAVVQVRPKVSIPGYAGLRVEVPGTTVSEEEIDRQVDRMRRTEAELVEVDRPAIESDHVTVDVHGTAADGTDVVSADDYVLEVGSGRLGPELDASLQGAKPGDVLEVDTEPEGASGPVHLRVLVKEVREERLPEATDEWAAESSEFETIAGLRADLSDRMRRMKVVESQIAMRQNSLDALAELVDDDEVPDILIDAEVQDRLHDMQHRLAEDRIDLAQYLQLTGRSPDEFLAEMRTGARQGVKADLGLRALAEAEGLEVDEAELDEVVAAAAEQMKVKPAVLRADLDTDGRIAAVRSDERKRKALAWLLEHVELVDSEGNPVERDELEVDQGVHAPGDVEASVDEAEGDTEGTTEDAESDVEQTEEIGQ